MSLEPPSLFKIQFFLPNNESPTSLSSLRLRRPRQLNVRRLMFRKISNRYSLSYHRTAQDTSYIYVFSCLLLLLTPNIHVVNNVTVYLFSFKIKNRHPCWEMPVSLTIKLSLYLCMYISHVPRRVHHWSLFDTYTAALLHKQHSPWQQDIQPLSSLKDHLDCLQVP